MFNVFIIFAAAGGLVWVGYRCRGVRHLFLALKQMHPERSWLKNLRESGRTVIEVAELELEQRLRKSLVRVPHTPYYILSFTLDGRVYKVKIKPIHGPPLLDANWDDFQRGTKCIEDGRK